MKASDRFIEYLVETCAETEEVMTSPTQQEASARMLEVTRGESCRDDPIPMASGKEYFTSFLAWYFKFFPYWWNIGVVVTTLMDKDRQESSKKKKKAPQRLVDPSRRHGWRIKVQSCEGCVCLRRHL